MYTRTRKASVLCLGQIWKHTSEPLPTAPGWWWDSQCNERSHWLVYCKDRGAQRINWRLGNWKCEGQSERQASRLPAAFLQGHQLRPTPLLCHSCLKDTEESTDWSDEDMCSLPGCLRGASGPYTFLGGGRHYPPTRPHNLGKRVERLDAGQRTDIPDSLHLKLSERVHV